MQDDIERLLEYVAIGPRFSNTVLQVSWHIVALSWYLFDGDSSAVPALLGHINVA